MNPMCPALFFFFFFNDTATTEIYTLSLHDALPICRCGTDDPYEQLVGPDEADSRPDRKSTRLNSSHEWISYAVFCSKKKKVLGMIIISNDGSNKLKRSRKVRVS